MNKWSRDELVAAAMAARKHAYAAYSNYPVGAALLGKSGLVYTGCNVENASYSLTICAERVALTKAISEGEQKFIAIAVVTENGGSPCGACRQMLREFGKKLIVLISDANGDYYEMKLSELLPKSFSVKDLDSTE